MEHEWEKIRDWRTVETEMMELAVIMPSLERVPIEDRDDEWLEPFIVWNGDTGIGVTPRARCKICSAIYLSDDEADCCCIIGGDD